MTPSEVVHLALERNLRAIAITDHDTVAGVIEAQTAATGIDLEVIPGVEINTAEEGTSFHILGFYIDPRNPPLNERLQTMRDARLGRAHKMLDRLREIGMPLEWEEVQALAGGESVGRPHVARALLNRGHVATVQEAFDRFISRGGPAHVPRLRLTPAEAIRLIAGAGGVPVLAHPAHSGPAAVARIPDLVDDGLRGLEVYYPHHSPKDIEMLLGLCREYDLLATGGTDFHGLDRDEGATLGSVYVPEGCADQLRKAASDL
jgi:predicted metal-dependent phosphoesterase TrpH